MTDPHEIAIGESVAVLSGETSLSAKRETETSWLISRERRGRVRTVARIQQIPEGWLADPVYGETQTAAQDTWDEAILLSATFPVDVSAGRKMTFALLGAFAAIALVSFIYPAFTGGRVTTVMWVLVAVSLALVIAALIILLIERLLLRRRRLR